MPPVRDLSRAAPQSQPDTSAPPAQSNTGPHRTELADAQRELDRVDAVELGRNELLPRPAHAPGNALPLPRISPGNGHVNISPGQTSSPLNELVQGPLLTSVPRVGLFMFAALRNNQRVGLFVQTPNAPLFFLQEDELRQVRDILAKETVCKRPYKDLPELQLTQSEALSLEKQSCPISLKDYADISQKTIVKQYSVLHVFEYSELLKWFVESGSLINPINRQPILDHEMSRPKIP